jgi:Ty3 transposon capsid-like protein
MDRIENEAIEARFQQLESSIETICELLRELKPRKEEKKPESELDTPKRDEGEPNTSKTPFRVEAKVEIRPYDGQMEPEKLNNWIRQLEVYFSCYSFSDKEKISFSRLKMDGYALLWWESLCQERFLTKQKQVVDWEEFKTLVKAQFYPMGYEEEQEFRWHYLRQRQGQ